MFLQPKCYHYYVLSYHYSKDNFVCFQFSLIMQYDYKHTSPALVRGNQEPETRIETQRHKFHINLGPVEGATEV